MRNARTHALTVTVYYVLFHGLAFANEGHNILTQLSEEKRRYALGRLVQSAAEPCPAVTETFYQGSRAGSAFWNARCSNNRAYSVMLHADGNTKILDCRTLKAVGNVDCFKRF